MLLQAAKGDCAAARALTRSNAPSQGQHSSALHRRAQACRPPLSGRRSPAPRHDRNNRSQQSSWQASNKSHWRFNERGWPAPQERSARLGRPGQHANPAGRPTAAVTAAHRCAYICSVLSGAVPTCKHLLMWAQCCRTAGGGSARLPCPASQKSPLCLIAASLIFVTCHGSLITPGTIAPC